MQAQQECGLDDWICLWKGKKIVGNEGNAGLITHFLVCYNVLKNDLGHKNSLLQLTLSQTTNFRLFKLKEFADHNFKLYENVRKFSSKLENTVGKREIACYEQFLLFLECFQKTCTADT